MPVLIGCARPNLQNGLVVVKLQYRAAKKRLGGWSSKNGNVFNRGAPSDFDQWAQLGKKGWNYEDLLPLFKRMETWRLADQDSLRGKNGPLNITPSDLQITFMPAVIKKACKASLMNILE